MKKIIAVILAAAMAMAFAGCAQKDEQDKAEAAISFTDMYGREVELEKPAQRIIALTASDCEILYAIGAGHTIIGRGEYCDYPEEVCSAAVVQSGRETNVEQIIALAPEVVLMNKMDQTPEHMNALENAGIKVVVNDADDIEGVYKSIENVGMVVGREQEAQALVQSMRDAFEELSELSAGDGSESVYFEVSPLEYGLWVGGKNTFMDEVAQLLGLTNIFADVDGWGQVSEEQVLERDPDHIVAVAMYFGEGPTPDEEILSREGWQNVSAVTQGNVYTIDSDEFSRPGPRIVDAARTLYGYIYG